MNFSKYSRNYILCGDFDYHCLLCIETFHLTNDLEKHIRWEKHRSNIKNHSLLPKHVKEFISKIQNYYYCGTCNTVINNMKAVTLHIKNEKHNTLKNNPDLLTKESIGRYAYEFIELNNGKININTWNGVIGKKCVICNVTVNDASNHIKLQDHIIKLIQSEIIKNNSQYYRKINEDSFQCFTCKNVFMNDLLSDHTKKHDSTVNDTKKPGLRVSNSTWEELDLDGRIIIDLHRHFYHIDIKNKKAICKVCQGIVHPARRHLDSHLNIHFKSDGADGLKSEAIFQSNIKDHGKRRSELAKYGRDNYIRLNEGGRMGFCTLCDKQLSPHLGVFVEHVKGYHHTSHLRLKRKENEKSKYRTITFQQYVTSLNYCKKLDMFRINADYLIFKFPFLFLKDINFGSKKEQFKCFACGDIYPTSEKYNHCKTSQHKTNFLSVKFIVNNDVTILREIRPNLFHCGLCNEVLPFSKTLEKHLQSYHHTELSYKTSTLHPSIDAQQYYYQTLSFESISTDISYDTFYAKIIKLVYE